MGYTREVLSYKDVDPKPVFYTDSFRIDLGECFHLHYRNYRIEFNKTEFDIVSRGFFWARVRFILGGFISQRPEEHILKLWDTRSLHSEIGKNCPGVRSSECSVELQEQTDYIHLHYRGSRIEFTLSEFEDFSKTIQEAAHKLECNEDIPSAPRRVGLNHAIQPRDRVDDRENSGKFLVGNSLLHDGQAHTRKSVIVDRESGDVIEQVQGIEEDITYPSRIFLIIFVPYVIGHLIMSAVGLSSKESSLLKYLVDWGKLEWLLKLKRKTGSF